MRNEGDVIISRQCDAEGGEAKWRWRALLGVEVDDVWSYSFASAHSMAAQAWSDGPWRYAPPNKSIDSIRIVIPLPKLPREFCRAFHCLYMFVEWPVLRRNTLICHAHRSSLSSPEHIIADSRTNPGHPHAWSLGPCPSSIG